jgi:hypothetical protein
MPCYFFEIRQDIFTHSLLCYDYSGAIPAPLVSNDWNAELKGKNGLHLKPARLLFSHIPRNAGASIARALMTPAAREAALHRNEWRKHNASYDWRETRHGFEDKAGNMHANGGKVTFMAHTFDCKCSYWHIPIRYLERGGAFVITSRRGDFKEVANAYNDSGVLCVVRDPRDRALSEFSKGISGDSELGSVMADVNAFLTDLAANLWGKKICWNDCHFLPQYDYIFNRSGRRTCHHALRYGQNLKRQFDTLMDIHDRSARFPSEYPQGDSVDSKDVGVSVVRGLRTERPSHHDRSSIPTASEIHPEVAKIVRCAYALDMCLLGFDPTTGADLPADAGPLVDTGCRV